MRIRNRICGSQAQYFHHSAMIIFEETLSTNNLTKLFKSLSCDDVES